MADFKITKNAAKCLLCGDVIESTFRHDFVACSCGAIFVDGGRDYLRYGFSKIEAFQNMSETEVCGQPQ